MEISEQIFAVFTTGLAVSYGWGMRGAVIGGEKGAMLPGALLGLFLAKLSGIAAISQNAFIFSAVGCLAMGYGGFEPYGQTIEMVIAPRSDIYNPKRGYLGLMLKGANWFGICGAFLGLSFSAFGSKLYSYIETVIIFILIPFVQALGIRIFNKPYDKGRSVFPKIYFSRDRREEWGGNLLTLITLLSAAAVKGDWFAFFFGVTGVIGGAVGWAVAIWLYRVTILPGKSGKYFFGKAQIKGYIDNWKIMEFALGFIGGITIAAYFFVNLNHINALSFNFDTNKTVSANSAVAWLLFALALLFSVQYFVEKLQKSRLFEFCERTVYFTLLLCIVLLGNLQMARIIAFLLILWAVTEKTVFDREDAGFPLIIKATYLFVFLLATVCEVMFGLSNSVIITVLLYTFYYILADTMYVIFRPRRKRENSFLKKFSGCFLTYLWFTVLSVALLIISADFSYSPL